MILGQALPVTVMRSLCLKMKGLEKMDPKMPRLPDAFVNPHCSLSTAHEARPSQHCFQESCLSFPPLVPLRLMSFCGPRPGHHFHRGGDGG